MRIKEIYALATIGVVSAGYGLNMASAQTLGEVGTASAMSSGMNANSNAGTMAVGNRMKQDARRLGAGSNQAGMDAMAGDPGGAPGMPGGAPGNPDFPGGVDGTGGANGTAAARPRQEPLHWGEETGEDFVRELRSAPGGTAGKSRRSRTRTSARQRAAESRRLSRMTPAQRKKAINAKYKKPPIGFLAYYLPQDRYKVSSQIWRFVSIEDDRGRYPVKYYYRPSAANFLRLLGSTPAKSQARFNRVIGFHTWQDAMQAGYRPDPVSKPEPGPQLSNIARLTRGPQLARYLEWLYAGQITPEAFARNYAYIQRVASVVNSRKHTRPYMNETIGLVLGAAVGDNPLPRYIGPAPIEQNNQNGGMMGAPGADPGMPGGPGAPGMPGGPMDPGMAPGAPPPAPPAAPGMPPTPGAAGPR